MYNIQGPGLEEFLDLEDREHSKKWRKESKERVVLVAGSSNKEEKESGCSRVVRILEAKKEGQMEWRLQRVEEGYEELLTESAVRM